MDKWETAVRFDPREPRIVELARRRSADLIVMGLHCGKARRARPSAHLPGSTEHRVVAQARCPVLTVPYTN